MYDVCIVGAGPAGTTLARLIGRRHRVLLVDRTVPGREKLCGGLLAPRAQAELARQGLGLPGDVVQGPQLFAVRTLDRVAGLKRLYQRHYINVDRARFDRWLLSLAEPVVDVAHGWTLASAERGADTSLLRFSTPGGGRASVEARLVVGADGAASTVRRAWGIDPVRRYVAIQSQFAAAGFEATYGAVFDERLTDFYGWTIPKGGRVLVGAAFPQGAGVTARFEQFVETLRSEGAVMGELLSQASCPVARPDAVSQVVTGRAGAALVGEAAGFISPSSAEGISFALRSAARLAHALEVGVPGALARYASLAMPLRLEVAGRMVKSSALYGPTVRRAIMRSGLGALPPVVGHSPLRVPEPA